VIAVGVGAAILALPTTTTHTESSTELSTSVTADPQSVRIVIASGSGIPGTPRNQTYEPDSALVVIGYNATVIWYNADGALHSVTANSTDASLDQRFVSFGPSQPPFNNIQPGQAAVFTFTEPGIYGYFDSYHSWEVGKIIVLPASCLTNSNSSACTVTTGVASTSSSTTSNTTTTYPTLTIVEQTVDVYDYVQACATVSAQTISTITVAKSTTVTYILPTSVTATGAVILTTITNTGVIASSTTQSATMSC
jgi:plastocyanin